MAKARLDLLVPLGSREEFRACIVVFRMMSRHEVGAGNRDVKVSCVDSNDPSGA